MNDPAKTSSPWGEPARGAPSPAWEPAPPTASTAASAPAATVTTTAPLTRTGNPPLLAEPHRWEHPPGPERVRAALTMVFMAIILGAAAAVVLGVGVWLLAALFHHAASG